MGGEEVGWVAVDGERARLAQDAGVGAAAGDAERREAALAGGFDVEGVSPTTKAATAGMSSSFSRAVVKMSGSGFDSSAKRRWSGRR